MTVTNTTDPTPAQAVTASDDHPFVRQVREYAERVLRPTALQTEREGVTARRIVELRELGLLNHLAPAEYGGRDVDRNADRRIHEIVAGACFNTWLVWAQHAPLTGRLAEAANAGKPLADLARKVLAGELLLGAGISDVRAFPQRYIEATRADGGWIFGGTISWVSGWGLNSALTVAAVERDTETVVTALVEVGERTRAAAHLGLAAVAGSRTERIVLDDLFVPDEHVISRQTLERTRLTTSRPPATRAATISGWPRRSCGSSGSTPTRSSRRSRPPGARASRGSGRPPTPSPTKRPRPAADRTASKSGWPPRSPAARPSRRSPGRWSSRAPDAASPTTTPRNCTLDPPCSCWYKGRAPTFAAPN